MSLAKPGNEQSVSGRSRAGAAVVAMMLALSHILIFQATASAAHEIRVPMGTLTNFSVLAHSLITDTGGTSTFADGVGVWPGSSVVGISDGDQASGGIHLGDALAEQAQSDFSLAYAYAAAQIPEVVAAELGGQILGAGVYGPAGGGTALSLGTTLTLDAEGDKNAIFIVQTAGAFNSTATTGAIALINGAQACNVFFQVGGAVTLGAASSFSGTMLAQGAITVGAGVDFYGRGFTGQGDMTLSDNVFYEPTCDGTTVTPTHGLITTEAGSAATFTVVLNSQPSAGVAIEVSSSDTTEGTVDNSVLTFTQLNWATPQTVTVTGVDDPIVDGDVAFWVVLAPAIGGGYGGTDPADVSVTNTDNDALGVTVTPPAGLVTTEAGGTDAFTVKLDSQPSADVTIGVSSSDTTEGTTSVSSVTFSTLNWSVPQTVTVTGVNDAVDDGDVAYSVVLMAATGGEYAGIDPADVSVTNTDNDPIGITVFPTSGLVTTEAGGVATFTVVLDSQPSADVTIGVSSSDTTEGTASPPSLVFTTQNWATQQTVTVTGVDDSVVDGDVAYTLLLAIATGGDYAGTDPADVTMSNIDDDTVGVTVTPVAGLVTTEAGGIATFTVKLDSQPSAEVSIGVSSSDTTEGRTSTSSLVFTAQNWTTPQTVTVTGVDDSVADGDVGYNVALAGAVGGGYDAVDPTDVAISNTDDDAVGVTVTPTAFPLVTTEAGGAGTFTVVLASQPTGSVSIGVSSSDTTEGTTSISSLVFTAQNWTTPQTVTVTGVDDSIVDGDVGYFVVLAGAVGGGYDAVDPTDVSVINTDDDTSGGDEVVPPPTGLVDTSAACPASIATSGFGDLSGLEATTIQAIDCLAQYGISNGTSSLTFTPDGTVTRWQMALFLIRQVQVHGVVLPMAVDQGFVDLDGHNQETHDAIDQLAQLGITRGTGSRTFSPDEAVSRWEMALFLVRFLDAAGVSIPTLSTAGPFDDLAQMDIETTTAIDQLAALGVAAGTGTTTFEPSNAVLRWHMALFLTRVMALDGIVPS